MKETLLRAIQLCVKANNFKEDVPVQDVLYIDESTTDTQGFVGVQDDAIVIAFRETGNNIDVATDIYFCKKEIPYEVCKEKCFFTRVRVHGGFIRAYKSVRERILEKVGDLKCRKVFLTGFSLGGALATLCALDIQYNFIGKEIQLITFGSPKVGNFWFKRSFNKRILNSARVVNGWDFVTTMPPFLLLFFHVSKILKVGKKRFLPWVPDHSLAKYEEEIKAVEKI